MTGGGCNAKYNFICKDSWVNSLNGYPNLLEYIPKLLLFCLGQQNHQTITFPIRK